MYGTAAGVINRTGVEPGDLGVATAQELQTLLEGWLAEAQSLIDAELERDFAAEVAAGTLTAVPAAINGAAERIVANVVASARQRRTEPVVQVGEFSLRLVKDTAFTQDIRDDIAPFHARRQRRRPRISLAGYDESGD